MNRDPADITRIDELKLELVEAKERIRLLSGADEGPTRLRMPGMAKRSSQILACLARRSPTVLSKESLHNALYGSDPDGGPEIKIIDVFICKARAALRQAGAPGSIETVWGTGYRASPELAAWCLQRMGEGASQLSPAQAA